MILLTNSCSQPEKPNVKIPSKWVGTYEFQGPGYINGVLQSDQPQGFYTYVVGDIPHLFVAIGLERIGPVADIILENNENQLRFVKYKKSEDKDNTGAVIPGKFIHTETTYAIYASPATALLSLKGYQSYSPVYDPAVSGDTMSWQGPYTKLDSGNHDCREYQPPCNE